MAIVKIITFLTIFSITPSLILTQRGPRFSPLTIDIILNCRFENQVNVFTPGDSFYACSVRTPMMSSVYKVASVSGTHDGTKTNADVKVILIEDDVEFFPANLHSFFPNLEGIKITGRSFKLLVQDHLAGIDKLKYFSIINSPVEILAASIFSFNTKLETIDIQSYFLSFIHETAFDELPELRKLNVAGLVCEFEALDKPTVTAKKREIRENCQDILSLVTRFEIVTFEKAESSTAIVECKSSLLAKDVIISGLRGLEADNARLNGTINNLYQKIDDLNQTISSCEYDKTVLQVEVNNCTEALYPPSGNCLLRDTIYGYTCIAREIQLLSGSDAFVAWNGTYKNSKQPTDVIALWIEDKTFEIMPQNVSFTLINLETFIVENSHLKTLTKNDFAGLGRLKKLIIRGNEIATIESGTFDALTTLTYLDLTNNQIESLPSKAFLNLTTLKHLDVSYNQLTAIDDDFIPSTNVIDHFLATNNNLTRLDIYFVSRLRGCDLIDFTGNTKCNLMYDSKNQTLFANFNKFFQQIVLGKC